MTEPTLADAGWADAHLKTQLGLNCAVHRHRNRVPENTHHIWPEGLGGPNTAENRTVLCMNAHGLVHEFIRQLMLHGGKVPAATGRQFSAKIRALAVRGWTEAGKPVHGNGGE